MSTELRQVLIVANNQTINGGYVEVKDGRYEFDDFSDRVQEALQANHLENLEPNQITRVGIDVTQDHDIEDSQDFYMSGANYGDRLQDLQSSRRAHTIAAVTAGGGAVVGGGVLAARHLRNRGGDGDGGNGDGGSGGSGGGGRRPGPHDVQQLPPLTRDADGQISHIGGTPVDQISSPVSLPDGDTVVDWGDGGEIVVNGQIGGPGGVVLGEAPTLPPEEPEQRRILSTNPQAEMITTRELTELSGAGFMARAAAYMVENPALNIYDPRFEMVMTAGLGAGVGAGSQVAQSLEISQGLRSLAASLRVFAPVF